MLSASRLGTAQRSSLQLTGLDAAAAWEILRDKGLADIDNCEALIHRYQGNPFWLKSVATLIQELGIGAAELLIDDTILLPEDLKDVLHEQFDRTSELEKQKTSQSTSPNCYKMHKYHHQIC